VREHRPASAVRQFLGLAAILLAVLTLCICLAAQVPLMEVSLR